MKNNVTFDNAFWKSFGWFILIAIVICSLPWILAKHSLWIDFSKTGQIGDTIGGVMGPFIAIAAAGLLPSGCSIRPISNRDMILQ